jgi:CDP-2,3-bis-(O-geranylgeranyl)-sn-glycerol synthase
MLEALFLLLVANGSPVLVRYFFGQHCAYSVDGGLTAPDGFPWFGHSKTFRGIFFAIVLTAVAAIFIDVSWQTGALFGTFAMLGDLVSSFIKRRSGLTPSSKANGLDQIPESLFPLVACANELRLVWQDVVLLVFLFWILEVLLSRILYRLHIRNRPY